MSRINIILHLVFSTKYTGAIRLILLLIFHIVTWNVNKNECSVDVLLILCDVWSCAMWYEIMCPGLYSRRWVSLFDKSSEVLFSWKLNSVEVKTLRYVTQVWYVLKHLWRSRDSSVGIATGYGLEGLGSIRGSIRFLSSPQRLDRLWGPTSLLSDGYGGSFSGGKVAGTWSWPLTSI
jgi:hypothetical protein